MATDKPCAIPLCPAMRKAGSYVCAGHAKAHAVKPKGSRARSVKRVELPFDEQCRLAGLEIPVRELRFHGVRKWQLDFAFMEAKLAVEVEGGVFVKDAEGRVVGGRHTRGAGFRNDTIKYAEALILGWRILRVMPEQIADGTALTWCDRILRRVDNTNASV